MSGIAEVEFGEEMALNNENQEWVRNEIHRAIKDAIAPPGPLARRMRALKDWGVITVLWAVPLALLALVVTLGLRVESDNKEESVFRARTEDRSRAIAKSLKDLQYPSPLESFFQMDPNQLNRELGRLANEAITAKDRGDIQDLGHIDEIQKKLAAVPLSNPDASRAVSAVLNYASFVREKSGLVPNIAAVRASCGGPSAFKLEGPKDKIRLSSRGTRITGGCQELDGINLEDATFRNCLIIYNGGAVRLKNVTFTDCLFAVSVPTRPSAPAMQFANELLLREVGPNPEFTVSVG